MADLPNDVVLNILLYCGDGLTSCRFACTSKANKALLIADQKCTDTELWRCLCLYRWKTGGSSTRDDVVSGTVEQFSYFLEYKRRHGIDTEFRRQVTLLRESMLLEGRGGGGGTCTKRKTARFELERLNIPEHEEELLDVARRMATEKSRIGFQHDRSDCRKMSCDEGCMDSGREYYDDESPSSCTSSQQWLQHAAAGNNKDGGVSEALIAHWAICAINVYKCGKAYQRLSTSEQQTNTANATTTRRSRQTRDLVRQQQQAEDYALMAARLLLDPEDLLKPETDRLEHQTKARLDELASELRSRLKQRCSVSASVQDERSKLDTAIEFLFQEQGFCGIDEAKNYYEYHNSLLPHVLETKKGIPLTLAILFQAVCRRAGMTNVNVIGLPGHVVASFEYNAKEADAEATTVFVDVFRGGELMTKAQCRRMVELQYRMPWQENYVLPIETDQIMTRILSNMIHCITSSQPPPSADDDNDDVGPRRMQKKLERWRHYKIRRMRVCWSYHIAVAAERRQETHTFIYGLGGGGGGLMMSGGRSIRSIDFAQHWLQNMGDPPYQLSWIHQ